MQHEKALNVSIGNTFRRTDNPLPDFLQNIEPTDFRNSLLTVTEIGNHRITFEYPNVLLDRNSTMSIPKEWLIPRYFRGTSA